MSATPRTRSPPSTSPRTPTFTLIAGIAGEAWAAAAKKISDELDIPINTVIIGPGREVTDIYYGWARIREIDEDGVLLVRPDKHIGWRSMTLPATQNKPCAKP